MDARRTPTGIFAPVATTFASDGDLDLRGFRANLERYATSALDGIVVLGSNGEKLPVNGPPPSPCVHC